MELELLIVFYAPDLENLNRAVLGGYGYFYSTAFKREASNTRLEQLSLGSSFRGAIRVSRCNL